jgi:anti-sigma28 factor (negative regulator of flagellin synthesis)
MALSSTDKKEIETIIRKEIKDFIGHNTVKQFETKMMDEIKKELKRGKLEVEVKDIVLKMLTEFYGYLYQQRSQWQSRVKNV